MGRIRVFICTKNQKYSERIVRYAVAKSHPDIQFEQLTEITDKTELRETDVVVTDDQECLQRLRCHKILIVRQREEEEKECIFMYQDRESIYQRLLQILEVNQLGEIPKVTCVFSPGGGDEKTLLALQRALELGKSRRVLYISLCGFPVFFRREISPTPIGVKLGVSELFLCTKQEEFEGRLMELSFSMGCIDMIPPVEHYKDLLDFSREEVCRFMEHLKRQTVYDTVVLELGQLFEYSFELLSCAECVLVPKEPGFLAEVRYYVFGEYCRREDKEEVWHRLQQVPVSFPCLKDLEEVNQIFFGEEGEDGPGGTTTKGKNSKSRFGAGAGRRGA